MENSSIDLDIYSTILSYSSWGTLQELKKVNKFLYTFSNKEIEKKLKSKYPFGDRNAKISVITQDIFLESVFCIIEGKTILIPKEKYNYYWIRNIINSWFIYSFPKQEYILTSKLFKSMIRIFNKKITEKNINPIDEHRQTLTFRFSDIETILEEIK